MRFVEIENRIYYAIRFIARPLGVPDGAVAEAAHAAINVIRAYIEEVNLTPGHERHDDKQTVQEPDAG